MSEAAYLKSNSLFIQRSLAAFEAAKAPSLLVIAVSPPSVVCPRRLNPRRPNLRRMRGSGCFRCPDNTRRRPRTHVQRGQFPAFSPIAGKIVIWRRWRTASRTPLSPSALHRF
jgi:hypothetical protein